MIIYKWDLTIENFSEIYRNDFYNMHKIIWSLFGNKKSKRKFLYRILYHRDSISIIIQSTYPIAEKPHIGDFFEKNIEFNINKGEIFKVSSTLNPVVEKSRMDQGKKNSTRVPLTDINDIKKWAIRLFEKRGFKCRSLNISPPRKEISKLKKATMSISDINGVFEIIDEQKAFEAFVNGVGKCKYAGCGLLFLTPLNETLLSDHNEDIDNIKF